MNEMAELRRRIAELEKSETGLKQLEEERINVEVHVRRILDNMLEGCMIIGFDWTYLYVNEVAARHGHQSRENLIGRTMLEIYPGVEKSAIFAAYRRCMEERVHQRLESEYTFPDGTTNWYEFSIEPVPEGIFVLSMDITERKRAEEDLKAAHKRFEDVLNSVDSLVYAIDMKTYEILFINRFGRENWGEIEGKICWQTLQQGQSGPCGFCTNKKLIGPDGKPSETVVWEIQNTINKRWYECRDKAIYWPDGRLVRIEIATDITDREQIEEALKESEERYRTIIEFSNDMIWILDTDGCYQFVNKRCEEFSGLKMDYFLGKSFTPFIEQKDLPRVVDIFHRTLNGEPQQYEVSVKKEDGSNFFLLVNTAPIYSREKVVGTVSFGRDITEHKKGEEQIKECLKQKLKKSNNQNKLLSYLIEGTRGGKTRALILRHLSEKSYNAHQLAKTLKLDYKTIRHHLEVLVKYGMITRNHDGYYDLYFISKNIESDLNKMDLEL